MPAIDRDLHARKDTSSSKDKRALTFTWRRLDWLHRELTCSKDAPTLSDLFVNCDRGAFQNIRFQRASSGHREGRRGRIEWAERYCLARQAGTRKDPIFVEE
jgi:hypothetical protein